MKSSLLRESGLIKGVRKRTTSGVKRVYRIQAGCPFRIFEDADPLTFADGIGDDVKGFVFVEMMKGREDGAKSVQVFRDIIGINGLKKRLYPWDTSLQSL